MSNRIKDVFAIIYSPLVEGKRILALSRADAERIPPLPGVAMLSITAPGTVPANVAGYEHLLRQSFSDVNFVTTNPAAKIQKKTPTAITKEQALEIHDFVQALPDSIHTLLIHCEGGFSRSCGVASALTVVYGFEVEDERLKRANQSVKKMLLDVVKTKKKTTR